MVVEFDILHKNILVRYHAEHQISQAELDA